MEGETSQTVTGGMFDGEPEISFESTDEGEDTQAVETPKAEPEAKEPEANDDDVADFMTVRYNKADKKLSRKEAVEYAQKGMNYDKIYGELQSYKEGAIGRAIKAYADAAGMSVDRYAEMMIQQQEAAQEKQALAELQEKYPEAPEELLKDYAKLQLKGNKADAMTAEEAKRQKEWSDALAEYPDISADSIPQDVHDAVANGVTPLDALRMHELNELRAKVQELTSAKETKAKQEDNRARSIGSASGVSGGEPEDEFLAGMASRVRS